MAATLKVRILGDARDGIRALDQMAGRVSRFNRNLGGAGIRAGGIALGAAAAGITAVGYSALKSASQIQDAGVAFEVLTGSASKAQKLLKSVQGFAIETPFSTTEVLQSTKLLLNTGTAANKVIPTLRVFGDAVAAGGGGTEELNRALLAYSQIVGKGTADTRDLYQLVDAGIPAFAALRKELGLSGAELQKAVEGRKVTAANVFSALSNNKAAKGALQKMNKTLSGQVSNLKDTFTAGLGNALQPVLPVLTREIAKFIAFLEKVAFPGFTKWLTEVMPKIQRALPRIGNTIITELSKLPSRIKSVVDFVRSLPATFSTFVASLGPLGAALKRLVGGTGAASEQQSALEGVNQTLTALVTLLTRVVNFLADVKNGIDGTFGEGTTAKIVGMGLALSLFAGPLKLILGLATAISGTSLFSGGAKLLSKLPGLKGVGGAGGGAFGAVASKVGVAGLGLGAGFGIGTGLNKGAEKLFGKSISNAISDGIDGTFIGNAVQRVAGIGVENVNKDSAVSVTNNFRTQLSPAEARRQLQYYRKKTKKP